MKVERNENELIIRETPGCLWVFGLFFVFVGGIFVYGSLGGFTNYKEVPWWANGLALLMGSIGVGVGIWQIWMAPVTKVVINRLVNTITITRRGILKTERNVYDFEQIKGFRTIEGKDSEGDPIWYFGVEFTSGMQIEISSMPSHSEDYKRELVYEANQFTRKHALPYQFINELEDESPEEMS